MDQAAQKPKRLKPWYIGLVIILAAVTFAGYRMWAGNYPAPHLDRMGVLTVIPTVYLVLMYLTSSARSEPCSTHVTEGLNR